MKRFGGLIAVFWLVTVRLIFAATEATRSVEKVAGKFFQLPCNVLPVSCNYACTQKNVLDRGMATNLIVEGVYFRTPRDGRNADELRPSERRKEKRDKLKVYTK